MVAAPADGVAAASCVMPHASAGVAVKAAAAAKLIASFLIVSFIGWLLFHGSSIHEALDEEGEPWAVQARFGGGTWGRSETDTKDVETTPTKTGGRRSPDRLKAGSRANQHRGRQQDGPG